MEKTSRLIRVTLTLDPVDVDLIDRLAVMEGKNRSQELRGMLSELRPMLQATVGAFEAALRQRDQFDEAAKSAALAGLEALFPEVEAMSKNYLGAMARIEGAAAAAEALDPRPSNHGGHNLTPTQENPVND